MDKMDLYNQMYGATMTLTADISGIGALALGISALVGGLYLARRIIKPR